MARTYNPFEGNLAQYGFGPEHLYFSDAPTQAPTQNTPPGTSQPNPYTSENNPYVNAFRQGQSSANDTRGDRDSGVSGQSSPEMSPGRGSGMNATTTDWTDLIGGASMAVPSLAVQAVVNGVRGQPAAPINGLGFMDAVRSISDAFTGNNNPGERSLGERAAVQAASDAMMSGGGNNPPPGPTPTSQWAGLADFTGGDPGAYGGGDYGAQAQADAAGPGNEGGMLARGGPVPGQSGGQSDKVPAMLSHGEYVIDAPTVALLGGGNNEAGAKMLDRMRSIIRKISTGSQEQPKPVSGEQLFSALAGRTS